MVTTSPATDRRRRERALAGDRRAGAYARSKARREQYAYARRAWWPLLLTGGAMLLAVGATAPFMPAGFARGALVGSGTTAALGWLAFWVVLVSGTAPKMMGDQAERWTAGELRKLRRHGYKVVNAMMLKPWDIDHVLLGPSGAYAVETKWSATPWDLAGQWVRKAASQVTGNARDLRLWADLKRIGITQVSPVLMLWGAGAADPTKPAVSVVDGVTVVLGPRASEWTSALGPQRLTVSQVSQGWLALADHTDLREKHNPGVASPPSVPDVLMQTWVTFGASLLGLIAGLQSVRLPGGAVTAATLDVGVVLALVMARRRSPASWRYPLLGGLVGLASALGLIGLLAVLATV